MYAFHRILADYSPLVQFYILDARGIEPSEAAVKLTVLVHPFTSSALITRLQGSLDECMSVQELADIADDFDIKSAEFWFLTWTSVVMRSAVPL